VRLDGLRVLLVEDNEINQQVAVELMQGVGVAVDVAGNGREAVEKLETTGDPVPYDVVLMDVQMPEMDGYQATARIRSRARFAGLPIVAMTAHATVEERQRCVDAGMVDHVSKPIDPAALYALLARIRTGAAKARPADVTIASRPSPAADLPAVEGLDAAQGLRRVAGNQSLYLSLLRRFLSDQADAAGRIRDALERSERTEAERLAHTLKGVAGNLAAGAVQASAGDLERAIRDGSEPGKVEALRTRLAESMDSLSSVLRPWLEAAAPSPAAPAAAAPAPADPAALRGLGARWARLLQDCDAAAIDDLERDGALLQALFGDAEAHAGFARRVNAYDFEGAAEALREAAGNKGIEV
jgi:two-component system sensor histidine kinase/response regulator